MPGQQLANPSITSPRMGDRSKASRVSPRNMTGQRFAEQHADKDARDASKAKHASLDVEAIKRAEYLRGYEAGFDKAHEASFNAGWEALAQHLVEIGVLDPDEPEDA
jgi:hypothetical protein